MKCWVGREERACGRERLGRPGDGVVAVFLEHEIVERFARPRVGVAKHLAV